MRPATPHCAPLGIRAMLAPSGSRKCGATTKDDAIDRALGPPPSPAPGHGPGPATAPVLTAATLLAAALREFPSGTAAGPGVRSPGRCRANAGNGWTPCRRRVAWPLGTCALVIALAVPMILSDSAVGAEDDWSRCSSAPLVPARPDSMADTEADSDSIHLSAFSADVTDEGITKLTGNVVAEQGTRQLESDELSYTPDLEVFDARGNVRVWDDGMFVSGDSARADIEHEVTTVSGTATYVIREWHGHGSAARISAIADERLTAADATYTTCDPDGPDDPDWRITASHVEFDRAADVGVARHAWLELDGTPVFYVPWFSFPLSDRRKSGFLSPTFGVDRSNGIDVTSPYYFNLAPNYDATLSARAMSERGVQAQGEFRFLSRTYGTGRAAARYLPFDREFDDDRAGFDIDHRHRWTSRWSTDARFEWVSDADFYEDFGANLAQASQTHLLRRMDANYLGDGWTTRVRFEDYLTADRTIPPAGRPYARIPQILFGTYGTERNRRVNVRTKAEVTYFEKEAHTSGMRADLRPSLSYPIRTAGTFLVPRVTLDVTQYALHAAEGVTLADDSPSRVLPILSLDGGMFLERPLVLQGRNLTHTLEPRLYYLHVPFERQSHLPDFDTSLSSFSFAQLFRENRYSGRDRIGDANQLTLALTSRLLDEGSDEVARASIGQIRYFRDREVVLGEGEEPDTTRVSDLVAEIEVRPSRGWRLRTGVQYDSNADRTTKGVVNVRYQPNRSSVVNAAYRFVRDADPSMYIEQADLSFAWPLGTHWRTVGRWNFALGEETDRTLEAFAGLEYESCCWGFRTVVRRFFRGDSADGEDRYSHGVFLQLELKGLTDAGGSAEAFLRRSIPGYENEF